MYFVFCISITFFSVICIWNAIWAKQRINLTFLLWMVDAPYASISSPTGCTIQNLWVKELRYLSDHILQSSTFKCSLSNHTKTVYRSANAIFGKIGLIVSEDVILQLIKSTCISSYGRTLSDASMLYFAAVFFRRLSWPNGWTDLHETFTRGRY